MVKNLLDLLIMHTRRACYGELNELAGERDLDITSATSPGDIRDITIIEVLGGRPDRDNI